MEKTKKRDPNAAIYRVQFKAYRKEIKIDTRFYRHLRDYEVVFEKGYFKYYIGNEYEVDDVNKLCNEVRKLGHKKAFVVVFKGGKKGTVR